MWQGERHNRTLLPAARAQRGGSGLCTPHGRPHLGSAQQLGLDPRQHRVVLAQPVLERVAGEREAPLRAHLGHGLRSREGQARVNRRGQGVVSFGEATGGLLHAEGQGSQACSPCTAASARCSVGAPRPPPRCPPCPAAAAQPKGARAGKRGRASTTKPRVRRDGNAFLHAPRAGKTHQEPCSYWCVAAQGFAALLPHPCPPCVRLPFHRSSILVLLTGFALLIARAQCRRPPRRAPAACCATRGRSGCRLAGLASLVRPAGPLGADHQAAEGGGGHDEHAALLGSPLVNHVELLLLVQSDLASQSRETAARGKCLSMWVTVQQNLRAADLAPARPSRLVSHQAAAALLGEAQPGMELRAAQAQSGTRPHAGRL
jgi:hypothetical protein